MEFPNSQTLCAEVCVFYLVAEIVSVQILMESSSVALAPLTFARKYATSVLVDTLPHRLMRPSYDIYEVEVTC